MGPRSARTSPSGSLRARQATISSTPHTPSPSASSASNAERARASQAARSRWRAPQSIWLAANWPLATRPVCPVSTASSSRSASPASSL